FSFLSIHLQFQSRKNAPNGIARLRRFFFHFHLNGGATNFLSDSAKLTADSLQPTVFSSYCELFAVGCQLRLLGCGSAAVACH
ncbi:MAG: hypothetical protein L0Z50_38985, partial [Verrucomicrobiales bacterium]|nr:hypothetical protein [Verrucomicrobiales bacterium]